MERYEPEFAIQLLHRHPQKIKVRFPNITMHSFSRKAKLKMVEVSDGLTWKVVRAIHEAGLDSLPGGGAEILN